MQRLQELQAKKTASFVLVKGRRRVGKSCFIKEFNQHFDDFYSFSGLPPDKKTQAKYGLEEFSKQMVREFKTPVAQLS